MGTIAIVADGTLLQHGSNASTQAYTTVPEVKKLSGPSVKFTLLDATSHDSTGGFQEYIPGLADGDNLSSTINWKPSNAVHIALRTDSYARTLGSFKVVFPDDSDNTVVMSTYISNIVPTADIGAILAAALTVKVTGEPIWS